MSDWGGKLLSVFGDRGKSTDFHKYVDDVNQESVQFLDMQQELNESSETRPSYDQLGDDLILSEAHTNIMMLKTLEAVITERINGYSQLGQTLLKSKQYIDTMKSYLQKDQGDNSLSKSLDSLYAMIELEQQQAKQQLIFSDLRRLISEVKTEAQKKIADYSNQLSSVEKEVVITEKKVAKAVEKLEKAIETRYKLDIAEDPKDVGLSSPVASSKSLGGFSNFSSFATSAKSLSTGHTKEQIRLDKIKESDDAITKCDSQLEDDKRSLRSQLANRDQVRSASRKAFQKLDKDCKSCIESALRKITIRERESADEKLSSLKALETNVENIKCDIDVIKFISSNRCEGCDIVQFTQALSIISDKHPEVDGVKEIMKKKLLAKYADEGIVLNAAQSAKDLTSAGGGSPTTSFSLSSPKEILNSTVAPSGDQSSPLIDSLDILVATLFAAKYNLSVKYKAEIASAAAAVKSSCSSKEQQPIKVGSVNGIAQGRSRTSSLDDINLEALIIVCQFRDHVNLPSSHLGGGRAKISNSIGSAPQTVGDVVCHGDDAAIEDAVVAIVKSCCDQAGRDAVCIVLNKYRSKTHTIDLGYSALASLLWVVLEICLAENDVHTAKVIMMLSQTFFRQRVDLKVSNPTTKDSDDEDDDGEVARGTANREYVNEMLIGHPIWENNIFWEQALWECVQEQLGTVPYETPWFEMEESARLETVERVHSVIFSQVMAITHSMMELGVTQLKIREFVYRMSTNHQLSEYQRHQLLMHLLQIKDH